ncbi:glycosyltransferase family 4 protein [Bacillaceae bacterium Marseille-Q3522]|nr:glycosyltransferase family 4 protein [Bacillaceae bacterium Marseille-Q3522]
MNIGIFTDTYYPQISGVSTSVIILKKELELLGHHVYIFTSSDSQADLENEKGHVFRFPSFSALVVPDRRLAVLGFIKAAQIAQRLNLDIIHTQTEFSMGLMGKHVAKKLAIPFVHTYHTMYEDYLHYVGKGYLITPKMVEKLTLNFCKQAHTIIAPTAKVYKKLHEYGVQNHVEIIPTGIDFSKFSQSKVRENQLSNIRRQLGLHPDDKIIITISRLAKEKNISAIIKAMPDVIRQLPQAKLVIVGDGPSRLKLEQLAIELNLQQHCFFTGQKEWREIPLYYRLGEIFVSASTSETQGLTYFEAMASEMPVVAKRDASLKSVIEDHVTGYLFDHDQQLADLLIRVFQEKEQWPKLVENAKQRIYPVSSKQFAGDVESVYQKAEKEYVIPNENRLKSSLHSMSTFILLTGRKVHISRKASRHK